MARNQRGSNNNNPEGRNQYSGGVMDYARERPMTAAAAAAAAVGAGVFLWSRRSQISEQLTSLSDQVSQWSQSMESNRQSEAGQFESAGETNLSSATIGGTQSTTATGSGRL